MNFTYYILAMQLIYQGEDYRACVYNDQSGKAFHIKEGKPGDPKATVGIGFNLEDTGLTFRSCLFILIEFIDGIEARFNKYPWFQALEGPRRAVVIDMIYNLGDAGFLEFKGTIAALSKRDWNQAATNMEQSLWYKQVGQRAVRNVKIMREGKVTF